MHVIVTGASSGIGEAIAREFALAGARLTLVARRRALLEKLREEFCAHGRQASDIQIVECDLGDPERATPFVSEAEAVLGPTDVLVNNAGAQVVAATLATDVDKAEATLKLNLLTPLRLLRCVLPAMVARGSGCIVNVASLAAIAPTPGMTWYNAGKAGLAAASEALRGELRRSGVHIVTVYPGPIRTQMAVTGAAAYEGQLAASMPIGDPAVLARKIRRAVAKRQARIIYPGIYTLARWLPGPTRWFLDNFSPPVRG